MGKIAFVFSGQGDQHPGMGRELYGQYESARRVFDACDALRPGTSDICFCGTEEELMQTKNTQPCLFALELAAYAVLTDAGIHPSAVAGFSLGEVSASAAAGLFDLETAFSLVCRRGELMQEAAEKQDTSMAAVVKLPPEKVEQICADFSGVYPVNYNCPGQVSVSGLSEQMPEFTAAVKAAGGRAIPLKVKGAFHSPFMNDAAAAFTEELRRVSMKKLGTTLYSNMTARPYEGDFASLLGGQICSPVRWESIIRAMIASGIDTFIEIGPGKTLTNMTEKIDPEVKRFAVCELSVLLSEVEHA